MNTQVVIGTDDVQHSIVQTLIREFDAQLYIGSPVDTIFYASTCKYVVLSHGSFSATIGWMAFFSKTIYYPPREPSAWYGDMFTYTPTFVLLEKNKCTGF